MKQQYTTTHTLTHSPPPPCCYICRLSFFPFPQVGALRREMEESAADRAMVDKELKKRRVALEAAFKNWQRCERGDAL